MRVEFGLRNAVSMDTLSALNYGVEVLQSAAGNRDCRHEAEIILSQVMNKPRIDLYLNPADILSAIQLEKFEILLEKRRQHVPLQYLAGTVGFFGLDIQVRPGVFIPRPETETLVERIIDAAREFGNKPLRILELCSGSGCIGIALTKHIADCRILAADINPQAVALGRDNARALGVEHKITFSRGDLFAALDGNAAEKFDMIISNPPYVCRGVLRDLPREIGYEPQNALDGGEDGLFFLRKIIDGCAPFLKAGGLLAMESGDAHQQSLQEIVNKTGIFQCPEFFADLNGVNRFMLVKRTHG